MSQEQDSSNVEDNETVQLNMTMPKNFPLLQETKRALQRANPPSKRVYIDKHVNPFITEYQNSIVQNISLRLQIATNKFKNGEYSLDQFHESRDDIYSAFSKENYDDSKLVDAITGYLKANDAYTLFYTKAIGNQANELTFDNLAEFVERESAAIAEGNETEAINLVDTYNTCLNNYSNSDDYNNEIIANLQKLKQIIYIAVYPDRPIPGSLELKDDTHNTDKEEDDEIAIDGGKISLTCPISREIFNRPYKSTVCGHTYDLDPLKTYLRSSDKCPECGAHLAIRTTVVDTIMAVRVQCFKRDQKLEATVKDKIEEDVEKL